MRAWPVLALLLAASALSGPAVSHHDPATAGVIHDGPDTWEAVVGVPQTHRLQGQVHADGAQHLTIGLPNGFTDCDACHADWIDVRLDGSAPAMTHSGTTSGPAGSIRILDATWPDDTVLRIDFTVTITIDARAPFGRLPFDLGIRTTPASCPDACLSAAAVARVTAISAPGPTVRIEHPGQDALLAAPFTVDGTATSDHPIANVTLRIDDGPAQAVAGGAAWNTTVHASTLGHGPHELKVTATDTIGRSGNDTVRVYVDRQRPEMVLLSPHEHALQFADPPLRIHGIPRTIVVGDVPVRVHADDDFGIAHVTICVTGPALAPDCSTHDNAPYERHGWATLPRIGPYTITAQATDLVGHESEILRLEVLHVPTGTGTPSPHPQAPIPPVVPIW